MLRRILKNLAALLAGQGILFLSGVLLPPVFIASYGVRRYGEWLVLSAAVGYLSTLDFGLQTYLLNEVTMAYHRHDMKAFRALLSTGMVLILGIIAFFAAAIASVLFLPIQRILRVSIPAAPLILYLFALQIMVDIVFGYFKGVFRAFGEAHRGVNWANAEKGATLVSTVVLLYFRTALSVVALAQLLSVLPISLAMLIDLRRRAPDALPAFRYCDAGLAKSAMKPSACFGLFTINNFLLFQAPILILNVALGPASVALFSIARTMFSFVRLGLSNVQSAMVPEISRLRGMRDLPGLLRLYSLSESFVLTMSLVLNSGVLVISPLMLRVWLGKPQLFDMGVFTLMMAASVLMSVKEYKTYFQIATNVHSATGVMSFLSYAVMLAVAYPAISLFGIAGFLVAWISSEVLQTLFVHVQNVKLLEGNSEISLEPVVRLAAVLVAICLLARLGMKATAESGVLLQGAGAVLAMLGIGGSCYYLFKLRDVGRELWLRIPVSGSARLRS